MTGGAPLEEIPDQYLDMVMTCPVPQGQGEGAQALRDVLASEMGEKIRPHILKNIQNAQELVASGIGQEKATIIAFGGAVVTDGKGEILREPEPEPEAAPDQPELQLQGAEKK